MNKIIIIADSKNWVFDNFYKALKKHIQNFQIDVEYLWEPLDKDLRTYDLIFYLSGSNFLKPVVDLVQNGVDKSKIILAIRSKIRDSLWENSNVINDLCAAVVCSNEGQYNQLRNKINNVLLISGGVDTEIFTYKKRKKPSIPRIGWAGNIGSWGKSFRGLDIIERVCEEHNYIFIPALKDEYQRTQDEMVRYYHEEIDIYVEMSESTGRANGILEAMATGLPIISYNSGIAKQLIGNDKNGILMEHRNTTELFYSIQKVLENYDKLSDNGYNEIVKNWSWKIEADKFRLLFEHMLN